MEFEKDASYQTAESIIPFKVDWAFLRPWYIATNSHYRDHTIDDVERRFKVGIWALLRVVSVLNTVLRA